MGHYRIIPFWVVGNSLKLRSIVNSRNLYGRGHDDLLSLLPRALLVDILRLGLLSLLHGVLLISVNSPHVELDLLGLPRLVDILFGLVFILVCLLVSGCPLALVVLLT